MTQEINPLTSAPPTDFGIPERPVKRDRNENADPSKPVSKRSKPEIDSLITSKSIDCLREAINLRALRDSTNQKTKTSKEEAASKPTPKKSRKPLTPSKSASRFEETHNCKLLNTAHIADKVVARLILSLNRFALAYSFNCETKRGFTQLNGAISSCGGCHAAHAALSPKLYDSILQVVRTTILEKGFNQLNPAEKGYLTKRFNLSEEDRQKLASEDSITRIETFDEHASKLSDSEKRSSFAGTSADHSRNATFENPISSNRFDSYLEAHLRPLEDDLAEQCCRGDKTPEQALLELQNKYRELLETAIINLHTDLNNLENLHEAWDLLIERQKGLENGSSIFSSYLEAVANYQTALQLRFQKPKLQGTPSLKWLEEYLKDNQSPQVLKDLFKIVKPAVHFKLNKRFLKTPDDADQQFNKGKEEVERRLTEALHQLDHVQNSPDAVKRMLKYSFGERDSEGLVKTPDKSAMTRRFIELIPQKSDINNTQVSKKRTSRDKETSQALGTQVANNKQNSPPFEKIGILRE